MEIEMNKGKKVLSRLTGMSLALAVAATLSTNSMAGESHGAVYALTNQTTENSVMVYDRASDGALTYAGTFTTGGTGAGTGADPLASQGALVLHGGLLFAVNAGSNDISVFQVSGHQLILLDKVASGGQTPVSIAIKGQLVYVLNAGATPNISAFVMDAENQHLVALPNSQRPLAGGTAAKPAEVHFGNDGESLLVTEKGTQLIDSYRVDFHGYAVGPTAITAGAAVPFGFDVTRRGYAIVSEAAAGAVSSYDVGDDGRLTAVGGPILLGEKAPCWLVTSADGQLAFAANAGSGTISTLRIAADGSLSLVDAAAGSLNAPLDMTLSSDSHYLYARDANGSLTGFRVHGDGSLALVTAVSGIPAGAQGIAAR
jgi:6-phosphogluconolactonase (cycloisomerase 2 family)